MRPSGEAAEPAGMATVSLTDGASDANTAAAEVPAASGGSDGGGEALLLATAPSATSLIVEAMAARAHSDTDAPMKVGQGGRMGQAVRALP